MNKINRTMVAIIAVALLLVARLFGGHLYGGWGIMGLGMTLALAQVQVWVAGVSPSSAGSE